MRTTLTLDDDVAARLEQLRRRRRVRLRDLVNEALREGLDRLDAPPGPAERFEQPVHDLGACRVPSLDDVATLLDLAGGPPGT